MNPPLQAAAWIAAANTWTLLFAAAVVAGTLLQGWLLARQVRHVARHRGAVPAAFAARVPLAAHQKAADYTIARARLALLELAFGTAVLLGWTLLGGLSALNGALLGLLGPGMPQQLALLAAFGAVGALLDLPFTLYRTFVLEQRFGFNTTTLRLWLADAVKGALLGAAIGLPLAWAVLALMGAAGSLWWLWAWALWVGFNLLMVVAYPAVIAPLFNRFEPIEDAALTERIGALMRRCGFAAQGLFVMDASRRSAHGNAYFTGLGRAKRVVFFDTLLARLQPAEVEAVLAHELGHFRLRHIAQRMAMLFAVALAGFALLGWLAQQLWFYAGLGVQPDWLGGPNDALALLLFALALPVFGTFLSPLAAQLSRRHEFQADAFAIAHTNRHDLPAALLKLYEDNASTLTPDPLYARFHYSHPPAAERLAHMAAA